MKRLLWHCGAGLALALTASTAAAEDICHEFWFTRNLIFDRAGYCFGSPLGKAVFDNGDCTTKAPQLSAEDKEKIAFIKDAEQEAQCDVDTTATRLDFSKAGLYASLPQFPIRHLYGDGCIGWRGARTPLHLQPDDGAQIVGHVEPGDFIGFGYYPEGDWLHVAIQRPGSGETLEGWTSGLGDYLAPGMCDELAG